jgi:hypothetical protein
MEVAVRAGGPALALLGFTVFPLVWSMPEAAMTAELSVAYPEVMMVTMMKKGVQELLLLGVTTELLVVYLEMHTATIFSPPLPTTPLPITPTMSPTTPLALTTYPPTHPPTHRPDLY